ncbi:MAG TPA: hypothetical protein VFV34_01075 [Blastocatellia bacterium]|nr:hypothetical protein [Blastocatellia bacterium]
MDAITSPKEKWVLTPAAFDDLLSWLDHDRDRAGAKYEEIRSKLILGFKRHGCIEPEELSDETISRVARKLPEIRRDYTGDPTRYFFGVAHNVHLEYRKRSRVHLSLSSENVADKMPGDSPLEDDEPEYQCLERCIAHLTPRNRDLILQYYEGEGQTKIKLRKELATRLGIKLDILRMQAQRIRETLRGCILGCLAGAAKE